MEDSIIKKIFSKIKNKLNNKNDDNPQVYEYAFNTEELKDLNQQNKEKIKELKESSTTKIKISNINQSNLDNNKSKIINDSDSNKVEEKIIEEVKEVEEKKENKHSFINLSEDKEAIIMKSWFSIDTIVLDKNIIKGKEILNHNYTITYGDEALAYIYKIRDEYDIVIEYLIGFNNEKKGIYNKTIFSDKLDNEWRYLASYIKILEKIRSTINGH